ncbi:predicted protein [Sclerotinia sclerotiorum 1980 UF-70]|uniref:Uncharacterized protein n=1 Tax=Sclerotinia sclerotiorum (strain ATCC 18683 / 1980 / Ss-1) TaxID=665079 RepID=A7EXC9_SCLS1|nr:predicted protein [Sclerotinia sclerotiorum 1980 UF-70]EDN94121.1 predicted protein [Sclerotinia sclerotiorum 1980 UF-70]
MSNHVTATTTILSSQSSDESIEEIYMSTAYIFLSLKLDRDTVDTEEKAASFHEQRLLIPGKLAFSYTHGIY